MMKKIFFLFLFCWWFLGYSQTDTSKIRISEPPDSTAIGLPDGKSISKEIGPQGGTIISDDGKIELIFSAGALGANTTISIQPTTNHAPNGTGKAYSLEPSGIRFKEPVQVIFHYSDEESDICPPDLMGLGLQNDKGKWTFFDYDEVDSTRRVLKGFIHHFSFFTNVNKLQLEVDKKEIRASDSATIVLVDLSAKIDTAGHRGAAILFRDDPLQWSVNGIRDGDKSVGTVQTVLPEMSIIRRTGKFVFVSYTAPDFLPKKNPVTVAVNIFLYFSKQKAFKSARTLKTKISIYDMYRVSVIHDLKHGHKPGEELIIDSATFIATIFPDRVTLSDIQNFPPSAELRDPPQCKAKVIIDQSCVGSVNIANEDIYNYMVSKDSPPEIFWEVRSKKNLAYKFQYICKQMSTPVTDMFLDSLPTEIRFIANGQQQSVSYGSQLKIVVNPVRN